MEESGSPHELGTSAMIRSPSRSAQYSLRGDSTFTCSDRKSTRLNSSHLVISYAVFCLKKKNNLVKSRVLYGSTYLRRKFLPLLIRNGLPMSPEFLMLSFVFMTSHLFVTNFSLRRITAR